MADWSQWFSSQADNLCASRTKANKRHCSGCRRFSINGVTRNYEIKRDFDAPEPHRVSTSHDNFSRTFGSHECRQVFSVVMCYTGCSAEEISGGRVLFQRQIPLKRKKHPHLQLLTSPLGVYTSLQSISLRKGGEQSDIAIIDTYCRSATAWGVFTFRACFSRANRTFLVSTAFFLAD